MFGKSLVTSAVVAMTLGLATCGGGEISSPALGPASAPAPVAIAAGDTIARPSGRLLSFNRKTRGTEIGTVTVSRLLANKTLLGIDFRPADGLLYGVGSKGNIYKILSTTGVATVASTLRAATGSANPLTALSGANFGVDFNPVADRLRVVSNTGQNLRINVATGATTTDAVINRASDPASLLAAAYTNNFAGTSATALYDIDGLTDVLALQSPPNDGTLVNVGSIGVDVTGFAGLDIAGGENGLVLAALRTGTSGPFALRSILLSTGASSLYMNTSGNAALSQIGGASGPELRDIAIKLE